MIRNQGTVRRLQTVIGCASLIILVSCGGGAGGSNGTGSSTGSGNSENSSGNGSRSNSTNNTASSDGIKSASGGNATSPLRLSFSSTLKQIHFTWPSVPDATHYKIYQNADGISGFTLLNGNLTTTSYEQNIAVHQMNWPAARYFIEACNAVSCTASNEVNINDAVINAIGYFKASDSQRNDLFGRATSLSRDGNILAVGALGKDDQSGAVYVFTRQGNAWSQTAFIKASDASSGDSFGNAVSLSGDGNTLAVGSYLEDSLGTGVNGSRGSIAENNSNRGAVYVFTRNGDNWTEDTYLKANSSHDNAYFGGALSLNNNGNILAIGATGERTGGMDAGAVYVFMRDASGWSQQGFVKPAVPLASAHFGYSVSLNSDGNTLAVGAPDEYTGSNVGGSVYIFTLSANAWAQQAAVKGSNTTAMDSFGNAVALSADGNSLAISARDEKSIATGINGNQADKSALGAGAVYVFTRNVSAWSQQEYIKASNTAENYAFGSSLAVSNDGNTLAVGSTGEASSAQGVGGNKIDKTSPNSGAVYVFTHNNSGWSQQNYVKASNTGANDLFGFSVSLSGDGKTLAAGAFGEASKASGIDGDQSDDSAASAGAVYIY